MTTSMYDPYYQWGLEFRTRSQIEDMLRSMPPREREEFRREHKFSERTMVRWYEMSWTTISRIIKALRQREGGK
jgi:hypothetical protein